MHFFASNRPSKFDYEMSPTPDFNMLASQKHKEHSPFKRNPYEHQQNIESKGYLDYPV